MVSSHHKMTNSPVTEALFFHSFVYMRLSCSASIPSHRLLLIPDVKHREIFDQANALRCYYNRPSPIISIIQIRMHQVYQNARPSKKIAYQEKNCPKRFVFRHKEKIANWTFADRLFPFNNISNYENNNIGPDGSGCSCRRV